MRQCVIMVSVAFLAPGLVGAARSTDLPYTAVHCCTWFGGRQDLEVVQSQHSSEPGPKMDSEEPETGSIRAGSVKETHVAGLETAPPSHETGTEALLLNGNPDDLHRRLNNRQIQLIAIGGSIGTAIFVNIGNSLNDGGPASVLTAYLLYSLVMGMVNNCTAEMVTYAPVSGGFISLAAHWVDDAWGFMAGWNFFLYECLNIPFEITAVALCLGFWSDSIPPVAVCIACIALYGYLPPLLLFSIYCRIAIDEHARGLGY